tara:strand:- start:3392 stop:3616 length:225 start_codon:yes stop_codon:yes gene_type:complete
MEINIYLSHGGIQDPVTVPEGTNLGHIRTLTNSLQALAVPEAYNLAVGGVQQNDDTILSPEDVVTFRPVSSSKG